METIERTRHSIIMLNFGRVRCRCGWEGTPDHETRQEQRKDELLDLYNEHRREQP